MKKFLILLSIFLVIGAATQANALLLGIGDSNYVGKIVDGIPSNPADEVVYINNLITLAAGAGVTAIGTETYDRISSTNAGPFPTATTTSSFKDETGTNTANVLGRVYVIGKYDAAQAGSLLWYLPEGFTDVTLPATLNGHGISHISAYNVVGGGTGGEVPEPATIMLVGIGLLGAGIAGRKKFAK
jgi:hypothetical protein